jgi:diaminopimelate decarboxylase
MMITYKRNHLYIEQVSVEKLAEKYGTPLYVYSRAQLMSNFHAFDTAFAAVPHLTCYAVKANSNGALLRLLAAQGAGADVTSGGELFRALKAGFAPGRIVYAGIGKTAGEIEYALRSRILMFNVESIEELRSINKIALRLKARARIAFRINPHVDPHTHKYITTGTSGSKFGIPYTEAVDAYLLARTMPGIDVAGIHCHIGSQITSVAPFRLAARRIEKLMLRLRALGIEVRYCDLGGGLGIRYRAENPPSPRELAAAVLPQFSGFTGTFILEPGRYIVGDTGLLVNRVIYRKKAGGKNFIIVDAGMNDLVRPTLYGAYHEIYPELRSSREAVVADVVGPICETGDFIAKNRSLPLPEQGGLLAAGCAGAYGFAMSSQYNSRCKTAEVLVNGSSARLIRRRETYADLIRNEIV